MATALANPATATATASAPAAATAPTTTAPASTGATSSPAVTAPVQDGQSGQGALSPDQSVNAMLEAAKAKGYGADGAVETKPAATETAAAATTEETPATTDPAAGKTEEQDSPYSFEEDGFVGAKDLAAKIEANPALKASLPEDVRNEIMANARLAEIGAEYRNLFASPAEAKIIHETAQTHAAFAEAFSQIGTDVEKGTTAFLNKLIEGSALRDENGNPIKDDKGFYKTDGTANKFVEAIAKRWLNRFVVQKIEALKDENVAAALDLVMESAGLRPSTANKTENQDPALDARKAALDAQEAELKQQQESNRQQTVKTYNDGLEADLSSLYDTETGSLLKLATGLSQFERSGVEQELEGAIRQAIRSNTAYQTRKNQLKQRPMTAARRQAEVTLAKEFFRDNLVRIAKPIFAKAGVAIDNKSAQRTANESARAEKARSEVKGGSNPGQASAKPSGNLTPQQQMDSAKAEYKKQNGGKDPSDDELRIFMMLSAAKAKGF